MSVIVFCNFCNKKCSVSQTRAKRFKYCSVDCFSNGRSPYHSKKERKHATALYQKDYRKKHKHQIAKQRKDSYKLHRDQILLEKKAYHASNKERMNEKSRNYYKTHKEEIICYRALYQKENLEKYRIGNQRHYRKNKKNIYLQHKLYEQRHPEVRAAIHSRRRAAKASAPVNDFTRAQWREIKAAYNNRCVYCNKECSKLTMDHITALSKGGAHTAQNIVPACLSCNSQKLVGPPPCPVQPILFTLAPPKPYRTKK